MCQLQCLKHHGTPVLHILLVDMQHSSLLIIKKTRTPLCPNKPADSIVAFLQAAVTSEHTTRQQDDSTRLARPTIRAAAKISTVQHHDSSPPACALRHSGSLRLAPTGCCAIRDQAPRAERRSHLPPKAPGPPCPLVPGPGTLFCKSSKSCQLSPPQSALRRSKREDEDGGSGGGGRGGGGGGRSEGEFERDRGRDGDRDRDEEDPLESLPFLLPLLL